MLPILSNVNWKLVGLSMNAIRDKVVSIILDIVRPESPDLSNHGASLLAGSLDSLEFASVLMAIEDEFGLKLESEDVEKLSSIDLLVNYIAAARQ